MKRDIIRRIKKRLQPARQKTKEKKRTAKKVLTYLLLIFGTLMLIGMVAVIIVFAILVKDLPSAEELATITFEQSTRILDKDGNLLYEIHGNERRTVVKLEEMSRVPDAVIAAEDDSFYSHPGFDVFGLVRAGIAYTKRKITGSGRIEGGSTITQQFVKNTYLSPERTFSRKAKELILAMEVEQSFTKDEILMHYLNTVGFGSNAYGVESAARMYFDKSAKDLTVDESALLAGILQSPTRLSPYGENIDLVKARQQYVLRRMFELDMIDQELYDATSKTDTLAKIKPTKESIRAPHFVFYVRDELERKYGRELIERGGFTVTTTLDPEVQGIAERKVAELVTRNGEKYGLTNSALVSIDPRSGAVIAMVGSKNYFADDIDGKVNVTTSIRQPGSSFKPFIYANFFRMGFGPGSVLWDTETDFGRDYIPKNYDGKFRGPVTVRSSLGASLNIPVIKAMYVAGMEETIDFVETVFGFESIQETPRENIGLSFAIGAVEVMPVEMAQGYSVFATNGNFHPATSIQKVVDSSGKVLEEVNISDPGSQVVDAQVAYMINNTLSDCSSRPYGWGALCYEKEGYNVAAKTGTSNRKKGEVYYPSDVWTITYTPSYVTAMWAGNNDGSVLNLKADGLSTVAPLMKEYIVEVFEKKGFVKEEFPEPEGIEKIALSNLSGFPGGGAAGSHTDIISSFGKEFLKQFKSSPPVTAEVDESCGPALASEFSPPDKIKTYIYANTHDLLYYIRPEDPLINNFERTVRGFNKQTVGEGSNVVFVGSPEQIPTETCNKYDSSSVPKISIISPISGQLIPGQNSITVQITAYTPIKEVKFYFDDTEFGSTGACSTCSAILNAPSGLTGSHNLRVTALDEVGFQGELQVPLTMGNGSSDTPPNVRITAPAYQATFEAGSIISVAANADDEGVVAEVQFAYNRNVFATLTSWPYRSDFTIPIGDIGTQEITAIAKDNSGKISTHSILINVTAVGVSSVPESSSSIPEPPSSEPTSLPDDGPAF
jgi:membrane peptidoglycan carboxypeptidase